LSTSTQYASRSYRRIDPEAVLTTVQQLSRRIEQRFPSSGLLRVARDLEAVAAETTQTVKRIGRRNTTIRVVSWLLTVAIVIVLLTVPFTLKMGDIDTVASVVQVFEAALSASFFIGAAILFLLSLDTRLRRERALHAIHEMRALAHIVDMHQLTKDPALLLNPGPATSDSPKRTYTSFELQRYLDYCSEMLALISKVAVLYVQDFPDPVAVGVVDEIEDLTSGLARKIWQKIVLLDRQRLAGDPTGSSTLQNHPSHVPVAPTLDQSPAAQDTSATSLGRGAGPVT
jgi:hypothetical protein